MEFEKFFLVEHNKKEKPCEVSVFYLRALIQMKV